jgi:hydrogenase expression/formation protein HypE
VVKASFRALLAFEEPPTLPVEHGQIEVTTSTFAAQPLVFAGGDIGRLAICAAVNELAVRGAEPRWISAAFVVEEEFAPADLERIAHSMKRACLDAEVRIVGGDTKVVQRGQVSGVVVSTTGVGIRPPSSELAIANARVGDKIIVSGPPGDHGVAILAARHGEGSSNVRSDVAPVTGLVRALLRSVPVRCMFDLMRGGLARVAGEIEAAASCEVQLDERAVPFRREARVACERWGVDPLQMASAGRIVAVVSAADAARALETLRARALGQGAAIIGELVAGPVRG